MYFLYPLFGLLVVVVVYTRTLLSLRKGLEMIPVKVMTKWWCVWIKSHWGGVNNSDSWYGWRWIMSGSLVLSRDCWSPIRTWCSQQTLLGFRWPNRGNEMRGWKAWKPRLSIFTVFPQHFLNPFGVGFHESSYLPVPFTSMLFHFEAHLLLFIKPQMCHDKSIGSTVKRGLWEYFQWIQSGIAEFPEIVLSRLL